MFIDSGVRFSRGWVRKDGNLVRETGCKAQGPAEEHGGGAAQARGRPDLPGYYTSTYIYIYIYIYTHVCICVYIYIYIHMYMYMMISLLLSFSLSLYIYIYVYIYIYMYTCIHVYVYVYAVCPATPPGRSVPRLAFWLRAVLGSGPARGIHVEQRETHQR